MESSDSLSSILFQTYRRVGCGIETGVDLFQYPLFASKQLVKVQHPVRCNIEKFSSRFELDLYFSNKHKLLVQLLWLHS